MGTQSATGRKQGPVRSTTHHRIVVERRGGPEVLEWREEPIPQAARGEVRIKTLVAGVSAYDMMICSRAFPGFPRPPFTPGCDLVGLVDEVGDGVQGLEAGTIVAWGPEWGGGYAEFVCHPAEELVPVPDGVDPAKAVCLIANYLTAHLMLHGIARVQTGERILVQGAAGGVGTALLELGKLAGLEMYGTASKYNHELVESMGATPIDYRAEDVVERIMTLTGDGVDVVFDPIGGARQLWRSYRALRKGGRLVWFGVAASSKQGTKIIPSTLAMRFLLSLIPDGKHAPLAKNAAKVEQRETLAELLGLLAAGRLDPLVAERVPLAEAARAHELLARGGHAGKIVLVAE